MWININSINYLIKGHSPGRKQRYRFKIYLEMFDDRHGLSFWHCNSQNFRHKVIKYLVSPFGGGGSTSERFSHSVVSDSLRPHESQHIRPPCPSPTPGVHSDSRPSSQWCYPAISSSVILFCSCLESFPASVLAMNIQDWSPLGWTGWISLQSKGLSRSSPTPQFKSISSLGLSLLHSPTLTSIRDHLD